MNEGKWQYIQQQARDMADEHERAIEEEALTGNDCGLDETWVCPKCKIEQLDNIMLPRKCQHCK